MHIRVAFTFLEDFDMFGYQDHVKCSPVPTRVLRLSFGSSFLNVER